MVNKESIKQEIIETIKNFPAKEYVDTENNEFGWSRYTICCEVQMKHDELSGQEIFDILDEMVDNEVVQSGHEKDCNDNNIAYYRLKE